jgi:antitoxin component HigA of HigAB toxin-antitoxin module
MELKDFDTYLAEKYTQQEINEIDANTERKVSDYLAFKNAISDELKQYMEENNLGFNDIKKQLNTSDSQMSRILKGQANITMKTVQKIAELMGKKPRIIFE